MEQYNQTNNRYSEVSLSEAMPLVMRKVYLWMSLALLCSGITAYLTANNPQILQLVFTNAPVFYGIIIAEVVMVIAISSAINRLSFSTASLLFALYSVLTGLIMSSIFVVYTESSILSTFLITAGTFAVMSLWGYITKKDLSSWGNILFMALLGLVIATVVNIFMKSTQLMWITTYAGVIIFVGLTAYDTQKIKRLVSQYSSEELDEQSSKIALLGSLTLYLDFINLFYYLLRILGRRK